MALHPAIEDALRGKTILWGAPTVEQTRVGWGECVHAALDVAQFYKSISTAEFPGGGKIVFRTLDEPQHGKGFTYDGAVLDEVAAIKPDAWYESVRYTLSTTGGWGLGIGTPLGRNWFYLEHVAARDRADSEAWQIPTLGVAIVDGVLVRVPHPLENPTFPFAEAVKLFQTSSQRTFEQEFLAQFLEGQGAVFRNVRACVHSGRATPDGHAGHAVAFGVDWGQQNDFTAIVAYCSDCRRMVALERFNQVSWAIQRGRLAALAAQWKPHTIIAESNSIGAPIIEALQSENLPVVPFETTAASKPPLIQSLILAFERGDIRITDDAVLANELEAYEEKRNAVTNRVQYSAPDGMHDDTVMALALAWRAVTEGTAQIETVANREYSISPW